MILAHTWMRNATLFVPSMCVVLWVLAATGLQASSHDTQTSGGAAAAAASPAFTVDDARPLAPAEIAKLRRLMGQYRLKLRVLDIYTASTIVPACKDVWEEVRAYDQLRTANDTAEEGHSDWRRRDLRCFKHLRYSQDELVGDLDWSRVLRTPADRMMEHCAAALAAGPRVTRGLPRLLRGSQVINATVVSLGALQLLPDYMRPCLVAPEIDDALRSQVPSPRERHRHRHRAVITANPPHIFDDMIAASGNCSAQMKAHAMHMAQYCARDHERLELGDRATDPEDFDTPVMIAMRDSYVNAMGMVFNEHVVYTSPSLSAMDGPRLFGSHHLEGVDVDKDTTTPRFHRVINVAFQLNFNVFHKFNNVLLRLGLHMGELKRMVAENDTFIFLGSTSAKAASHTIVCTFLQLAGLPPSVCERLLLFSDGNALIYADYVFTPAAAPNWLFPPSPYHLWPLRKRVRDALSAYSLANDDHPDHETLLSGQVDVCTCTADEGRQCLILVDRTNKRPFRNTNELIEAVAGAFPSERLVVVRDYCFRKGLIGMWKTFSRAKAIFGPHGAGMINMFFAQPGTHFYEVVPYQRGANVLCFQALAQQIGIHATSVFQKLDTAARTKGMPHGTLDADINHIVYWLDATVLSHPADPLLI